MGILKGISNPLQDMGSLRPDIPRMDINSPRLVTSNHRPDTPLMDTSSRLPDILPTGTSSRLTGISNPLMGTIRLSSRNTVPRLRKGSTPVSIRPSRRIPTTGEVRKIPDRIRT